MTVRELTEKLIRECPPDAVVLHRGEIEREVSAVDKADWFYNEQEGSWSAWFSCDGDYENAVKCVVLS